MGEGHGACVFCCSLENSVRDTRKQCVQQEAPIVVPSNASPEKERVALDLSSAQSCLVHPRIPFITVSVPWC